MYIRRLALTDFKNIADLSLEFSPKINCISGNNGEGKTNLLDAIHYLSMTRSYFSPTDRFTCRHGTGAAFLNASYRLEDGTEDRVSVKVVDGGQKTVRRNDKTYERFSDHVGRYPAVMVSPYDTSLINGSSDERRRFLNMILSQTDREYMKRLQLYNKILAQRNGLLKMDRVQDDLLEAMAMQLSVHASYISGKRAGFCSRLEATASEYYSVISSSREEISIGYESDLSDGNLDDILSSCVSRDKALRYTTAGVHRDDLKLSLSGYPIKSCGSQGQQKSFLISLKLAQYSVMREMCSGKSPVLLLDDVFDKLDMDRVASLLRMVAGDSFGQIFITDSNKVRMDGIVASITEEHADFVMKDGVCTRTGR